MPIQRLRGRTRCRVETRPTCWENKTPGKNLDAALKQLLSYSLALSNPPLLLVCDRLTIRIHTQFNGHPSEVHTVLQHELDQPAKQAQLRRLWHNPESFRPDKTSRDITEAAAKNFATLVGGLRKRNEDADLVFGLTRREYRFKRVSYRPPAWLPRSRFALEPTEWFWSDCCNPLFRIIIRPMSTITFDTLQLVEQLRSAGIPQEQAEAVVKVIAKSQDNLLTTDHFNAKLETTLAPLRTDLVVLKWMMGVMLAGVMSLVLKAFF